MGDIEYLATQQFNGNVIRLEGAIDAVNDKLTHTVNTGKDGYILVAKISTHTIVGAASRAVSSGTGTTSSINQTVAKISANAVEIDRVAVGMATAAASADDSGTNGIGTGGSGYGSVLPSEFKAAIGMKAAAGQVIEIENVVDSGSCRAQLVILEVPTGTSPALVAQNITVDANITGEATDFGFIQAKVLAGDYFQVSGNIDAITNEIVFVVPNGKTAFLLEANLTLTGAVATSTGINATARQEVMADLKIDNVTKTKSHKGNAFVANPGGTGGGGGGVGSMDSEFKVIGLSLVGDGAKEISIENSLDNGSAFAEMSGYLVDT